MNFGFLIWTIAAVLFAVNGVICLRKKNPVGFFTHAAPPKVSDTAAYNRAVARIWFIFAVLLEIVGIPFLFISKNSPLAFLILGAVVILVIWLIAAYQKIERTYRV
jgi:predicted cobalt transporter CbtA